MKNRTNILLGILGAAAAGVVIGMIIAPQKGTDFRSDIKGSADDFSKKLGKLLAQGKSKYNKIRTMVDEEGANLKRSVSDFADDTTNAYREYTDKTEDTYNDFANNAAKAYKKAKS